MLHQRFDNHRGWVLIAALLLALLLTLALVWRTAAGQSPQVGAAWTRIGDTGGAGATAVARDPSGRVYAGTYYKGLFLSAGETNWSNPLPQAIAAIALGPNVAYAGSWGGGVFRSTDGGSQWVKASTGLQANDVYALALDPAVANTVYAGTEAGVFKTTDGGSQWAAASGSLGPRVVYALAFLGGALCAGTEGGAYLTTDGGGSWTAASQGLDAGKVLSLAAAGPKLYAGTDGGVYVTQGGTWTKVGGLSGAVNALAVSSNGGGIVVAGTADGVYVSAGSAPWCPLSEGLTDYALQVAGLALDTGAQPPGLYAATGAGIWGTPLDLPDLPAMHLPWIGR